MHRWSQLLAIAMEFAMLIKIRYKIMMMWQKIVRDGQREEGRREKERDCERARERVIKSDLQKDETMQEVKQELKIGLSNI